MGVADSIATYSSFRRRPESREHWSGSPALCLHPRKPPKRDDLYGRDARFLAQRNWLHKNRIVPGFTSRYGVRTLVYIEFHATIFEAIAREKQIKEWKRAWKIELIERANPEWRDLYSDINR